MEVSKKKMEEIKGKLEAKGLYDEQIWKNEYETFWAIVRDMRFWLEYGINVNEEGIKKFNEKYMELRKKVSEKIQKEYVESYCQRVITVVSYIDI